MKRLAAVLTAMLLAASTSYRLAPVAAEPAPDVITLEGRGFGHGRGMSQYGALGYAIDHDWSFDQILDHYYSNTTFGDPVENEDIKVHLTALDRASLRLTSQAAFTVAGVEFEAGEAARLRLNGINSFNIDSGPGCEGGEWFVESEGVGGEEGQNGHPFVEAVSSVEDPGDDISQMLTVCSDGHRRTYRGALRLVEIGGESFVLNRVPLESYVRGVVPRESPSWWGTLGDGKGLEALKAQAVGARSYSLAQAAHRRAGTFASDTCDTQSCQVYGGAALDGLPLDHGLSLLTTSTAVEETAGMVRRHDDGAISLTEFASSTGGWTSGLDEGSAFPAVEDLGDAVSRNPNYEWTTTISRSVIEDVWPAIGTLERIAATRRNGLGAFGGRVRGIDIVGTRSTVSLRFDNWGGDIFRRAFGLKSDWYRFSDFETADPDAEALYLAKEDGTVLAFGAATHRGDMAGAELNEPVAAMALTPSGEGYWLVSVDGGIFNFGDAGFHGSTGHIALNKPIVGIASTPSGNGYWLVASDGGIFAFGDAPFLGSMGDIALNKPVVGMQPAPGGLGYWLVASDGGIFAFAAAPFHGSTGAIRLDEPIVAMIGSTTGRGYSFVAEDGGVFAFGDRSFLGSRGGKDNRGSVVAMASTRSGGGYWIVTESGRSFPFGDAPDYVTSVAGDTVVAAVSPR